MDRGYRGDIDGLRAVSVVLVILFHLGITQVGGGFVGVDVFFVISGFLITGIIFDATQRGRFSFAWFYERRARRILPALMTVVVTSAVAGYVLLYPGDYEVFSRSAVAALLAWSNVFFYHNTGYFDIPSQGMPLLHTWSLGVEEQFYFVWPALLLVAGKLLAPSKFGWRLLFGGVIAVSFTAAIIQVGVRPKAAFYLPYARGWELALGALLVVTPQITGKRWLREILPLLGLAAIVYSAITLGAQAPFPGFNALPPVVGAALVIYSSGHLTLVQRLLAIAPLRFIGLISYSLYLWHWPLIVFWRIYNNGLSPSPAAMIILVALAFVLSLLSWWFVERPARKIRVEAKTVLATTFVMEGVLLSVFAAIILTKGLPSRLPTDLQPLASKEVMWNWSCPQHVDLELLASGTTQPKPSCEFGADWKTAKHHAIVWGDSLAEAIDPVLHEFGRRSNTAFALAQGCNAIMQPSAPQIIGFDLKPQYNDWCDAARTRVLSYITANNNIDVVVLATLWSAVWPLLNASQEQGEQILKVRLGELLDTIISSGKHPVILAELPASLGSDPTSCVMTFRGLPRQRCSDDPAYIDLATIKYETHTHEILKQVVHDHPGSSLIDPMTFLCAETRCSKYVAGEFIYRDAIHLRRNLNPGTVTALVDLLKLDQTLVPPSAPPD